MRSIRLVYILSLLFLLIRCGDSPVGPNPSELTLENLTTSFGDLSPQFISHPDSTLYTIVVDDTTESITVIPSARADNQIILYQVLPGGQQHTIVSGEESDPIQIDVGQTDIRVTVSAGGGQLIYSVTVIRHPVQAVKTYELVSIFDKEQNAYIQNPHLAPKIVELHDYKKGDSNFEGYVFFDYGYGAVQWLPITNSKYLTDGFIICTSTIVEYKSAQVAGSSKVDTSFADVPCTQDIFVDYYFFDLDVTDQYLKSTSLYDDAQFTKIWMDVVYSRKSDVNY
ncbi:cadherin-like beta sandwich domain-containing protein [candidate division KSB1 bacterium]